MSDPLNEYTRRDDFRDDPFGHAIRFVHGMVIIALVTLGLFYLSEKGVDEGAVTVVAAFAVVGCAAWMAR